jgi:hypothetical protein
VLEELRYLHQDATTLLQILREILALISEATRDTVFVGTDDYAGFAAICDSLRAQLESG